MNIFKSCKDKLFDFENHDFGELAMEIYRLQSKNNAVYKEYHKYLDLNPEAVKNTEDIPFLPIEFFKSRTVKTFEWKEEAIFRSSGTTGQERSRHYIHELDFYRAISQLNFEFFFGAVTDFHFLALLPSYLERKDSSLVFMVDHLIQQSASPHSGFYLDDLEKLKRDMDALRKSEKKIILWGVSFALLDLADQGWHLDPEKVIIMETGGMKGKRREMTRDELHEILRSGLNRQTICSEYGMTELQSQAYSREDGVFNLPPWMKVRCREINDPFQYVKPGQSGGLNIIDLANYHSCSFIETRDIGKLMENGSFEVMGRYDNSDIRGCNLLVN